MRTVFRTLWLPIRRFLLIILGIGAFMLAGHLGYMLGRHHQAAEELKAREGIKK